MRSSLQRCIAAQICLLSALGSTSVCRACTCLCSDDLASAFKCMLNPSVHRRGCRLLPCQAPLVQRRVQLMSLRCQIVGPLHFLAVCALLCWVQRAQALAHVNAERLTLNSLVLRVCCQGAQLLLLSVAAHTCMHVHKYSRTPCVHLSV